MSTSQARVLDKPVPDASQEMTLGQLVGRVLVEHGIADMFCIPGDFSMQLLRELRRTDGLKLRTMSHEYGTTLAALGYALGNRVPSAVCFTYGVGALNATNGIAQAYVERVPMIVFSGAPGKREREEDIFLHHTIVDHDSQHRVMCEVTVHQERISDAHLALEQIRNAISIAREKSRPVYVEIPRDLYLTKVRYAPKRKLALAEPGRFSEEALNAANHTLELLRGTKNPVLVPGLEIKRYDLSAEAKEIIEALGLPWVASPMSQGTIETTHPNYRGIFAGPASPTLSTRTLVEQCDLLLLVGEPNSDVNMGIAGNVPAGRLVHAYDGLVKVGRKTFSVTTTEFVCTLAGVARIGQSSLPDFLHEEIPFLTQQKHFEREPADAELSPFTIIHELNRHFAQHPETVLIADCGDSFFMSLGTFPKDVISSSLYMSMGIAVPGAIGYQIGSGCRPVVLVGDGAFHMTGLELMHAKRFETSPIIIVLNNRKWTSLSADESDKELTHQEHLEFSKMAHFLNVRSFTATTGTEFRQQLAAAYELDEPVLIDAQVDPSMRSYLCERFFDAIKEQRHLPKL